MTTKKEKLFYIDSYLKRFSAKVLDCQNKGEGFAVTLDQTAFYPEGGGQPSDIGTLNDVRVRSVQEHNGAILHWTDGPLTIGETVTGEIDWEHRFPLMQQHSGEHIVSGIVHQLFGFDNVGFHIGSELVTLDFNGELTQENLDEVERLSNMAIYANIPVEINFPTPQELSALRYRSKIELSGEVRIVTVPHYDVCACCGMHVSSTGEIGMIKMLTAQKYKGGTRLSILCGLRALADYQAKNKSVYNISTLLSTKTYEVTAAVERVLSESIALKQQMAALQSELFLCKIKSIRIEAGSNLYSFEENLTPNDLRQYCALLCKRFERAVVFSGSDDTCYKYAMGSESTDVRQVAKELNAALNGRGGGAKELAQGALFANKKDIEAYLVDCGFKNAE